MTMFENLARVMTSSGHTLKLTCEVCDHRAVWSRGKAFQLLGADCSPYKIRRRLKCGQCGERLCLKITV